MTRLLAGASTGATLLFAAATGPAFAQQLPDVYPGAVPSMPPAPATGPVPDLAPAAGQDPTPGPSDQCPAGPVARPLPGVDPRGLWGQPNPLAGERWFVDPREPAWGSYASYARHGRRHDAELMWRVAREPRFRWFGRWTGPDVAAKVRYYLGCAGTLQPGSVPLMVVMRHQGVGNARVVIGFEPDSLGTLECLARHRRRARLDVLRYGVDRLSQLPNATIYLEAGASDWEPARRTASQLRYIGIQKVRGFMLNVTHHDWTRATSATGSGSRGWSAASRSSSTPPTTAAGRSTSGAATAS